MKSNQYNFLKEIIPSSWHLAVDRLFSIRDGAGILQWHLEESVCKGEQLEEVYTSGNIELQVSMIRYPEERTIEMRLALRNNDAQSIFLHELKLIDLSFASDKGLVSFRTIDGGSNFKRYPPEAFMVHDYMCDGADNIWREHGWDGRSSEDTLPLLAVSMNDGALIAGLEWSGLWFGSVNGRSSCEQPTCDLYIKIPVDGLEINPGENFSLPAAHLVFSDEELAGAGNNCRRHIGEHVIPSLGLEKIIKPPVVYNHWFGLGPDINEEILINQADRAASLGVEYFVLDAGWYGGCAGDDFETGVGNWEIIDRKKFPNGLEPLAKHVKGLGLKFGIWFEPERAHVKSDIVCKHPEWFLRKGGETEDSYLHIDMSMSEVQEYIVELISAAIVALDAKWIKWDYNINPKSYWLHKDASGRLMFDYMQGLYNTQESLLRLHPEVVFECCASGGRRLDLGQLRHTHAALLSDSCTSSLVCRFMQQGANCFLPTSYLGAGIGFGSVEYKQNIFESPVQDWNLLSRMLGLPVIFGDIASLPAKQQQVIKRNIDIFKSYRHILNHDFFELLPQPHHQDDYAAVEFISYDRKEALIMIFSGSEKSVCLQLIYPMALDPDKKYQAQIISGTQILLDGGIGSDLMRTGWKIELEPRSAVAIRLIVSIDCVNI